MSANLAHEQSMTDNPNSSNIGISAGETATDPCGLRTIPRNGRLSGMGWNTPRRASLAPVHRFGSHCAKSHIRNCNPLSAESLLSFLLCVVVVIVTSSISVETGGQIVNDSMA